MNMIKLFHKLIKRFQLSLDTPRKGETPGTRKRKWEDHWDYYSKHLRIALKHPEYSKDAEFVTALNYILKKWRLKKGRKNG